MKWIMKNNGIEWVSPRKHIIISKRKSFFNEDKNIFIIYKEKRNYSKFHSHFFYDVEWSMQRWEYTLEQAIQFASTISDEILIVKSNG